ncbi:PEP-CTERM sorting domain-containing protein [Kiritimatiellaeota bacterium B1221]|nr:PEP-CTERM sorting domain-containing protein [Kiritimatiellaeota bacterium B1221]
MKTKTLLLIAALGLVSVNSWAETILSFGFDNNTEPNGIQYLGADQDIEFTGGVVASNQTNFNLLDGISTTVNFSIGAVGDLTGFSGTISPVGGDFYMGASGGGIDGAGSSDYFDDASEGWIFTFDQDVTLQAVNFYAPDDDQQTILVNGSPISGSPFSDDFSGAISVNSGDTLSFGYDSGGEGGTFGIDDFTISVSAIPEPSAAALLLLGMGFLFRFLRKK